MIEIIDLQKTIRGQHILRGVNLRIESGKTFIIIGPSGEGKSVLLRHLIGLARPDSGDICIDGESIVNLTERQLGPIRKKVGVLFQSGALFDSMTVNENVAFPLREAGERDPNKIRLAVEEALELVELTGHGHKMPDSLSGGMRKRVGLARTIISRPKYILYDEPTAGLDPVVSDSINRLIRRLQERFQITSLVVTHDMKSVFDIADRVAYFKKGVIAFEGTPAELKATKDPDLEDFILGRSQREHSPEFVQPDSHS